MIDQLTVGERELHAVGTQRHDLAVLDQLHGARMREERGDRRSDELLAVAAADHERALLTGRDEDARRVGRRGHERVVAAQPVVGRAHRVVERAVAEVARDQVRDDLGVGLGGEHGAASLQLLLELEVVLDDPVDHDVHAILGVVVRMGVLLGDAAVCGPARMPDAGRGRAGGDGHAATGRRLLLSLHSGAEVAEVANRAHGLEPAVREHRHARGVVAAILEPLEPGQDDLPGGAMSHVPDDPAHAQRLRDKWTGGRNAAPKYADSRGPASGPWVRKLDLRPGRRRRRGRTSSTASRPSEISAMSTSSPTHRSVAECPRRTRRARRAEHGRGPPFDRAELATVAAAPQQRDMPRQEAMEYPGRVVDAQHAERHATPDPAFVGASDHRRGRPRPTSHRTQA
jgi:hypothetical protein